jgi:hypothetical protein
MLVMAKADIRHERLKADERVASYPVGDTSFRDPILKMKFHMAMTVAAEKYEKMVAKATSGAALIGHTERKFGSISLMKRRTGIKTNMAMSNTNPIPKHLEAPLEDRG